MTRRRSSGARPGRPAAAAPGEDSNGTNGKYCSGTDKGSTIHADEYFSYDDLQGLQELKRVNHSKEYETKDGVNTNHVERVSSPASSGRMLASITASR